MIGTGTTGNLVAHETGLNVRLVKSGPYGGDLEIGARSLAQFLRFSFL